MFSIFLWIHGSCHPWAGKLEMQVSLCIFLLHHFQSCRVHGTVHFGLCHQYTLVEYTWFCFIWELPPLSNGPYLYCLGKHSKPLSLYPWCLAVSSEAIKKTSVFCWCHWFSACTLVILNLPFWWPLCNPHHLLGMGFVVLLCVESSFPCMSCCSLLHTKSLCCCLRRALPACSLCPCRECHPDITLSTKELMLV